MNSQSEDRRLTENIGSRIKAGAITALTAVLWGCEVSHNNITPAVLPDIPNTSQDTIGRLRTDGLADQASWYALRLDVEKQPFVRKDSIDASVIIDGNTFPMSEIDNERSIFEYWVSQRSGSIEYRFRTSNRGLLGSRVFQKTSGPYIASIGGLYTAIRISVKIIVADDGKHPGDRSRVAMLTQIRDGIERGNRALLSTGSKVRLDLIEVIELAGLEAEVFESGETNCNYLQPDFNEKVSANPTTYAYRPDAINVYYMNCTDVSVCARTSGRLIMMKINPRTANLAHEIGHYLTLPHTFDGDICEEAAQGRIVVPGDDGIVDTLPDVRCWTRDDMSIAEFGSPFSSLNPIQKNLVLDTFQNVMTYHNDPLNEGGSKPDERDRVTTGQFGQIVDDLPDHRRQVVGAEIHRIVSVNDIVIGAEAARRMALEQEFIGTWVATNSNGGWLSKLTISRDVFLNVIVVDVDSQQTPNLKLLPMADAYGDSMISVANQQYGDSLPDSFTAVSYTFRITPTGSLRTRIAAFGAESAIPHHRVEVYLVKE